MAHVRVEWLWIHCKECSERIGQYKVLDGEGRTARVVYRLLVPIGNGEFNLPLDGPYHHRRQISRDGSVKACKIVCKTWVRKNRLICACAATSNVSGKATSSCG